MLRHVNDDLNLKYKISGKPKARRGSVSCVLTLSDTQNRGQIYCIVG